MTQEEFDEFVSNVDNMVEGYETYNFYIGNFMTMDNFKTYKRFVLKPLNIIIVKNEEANQYTIDWIHNDKPLVITAESFMDRLEIIKNNMRRVLTFDGEVIGYSEDNMIEKE